MKKALGCATHDFRLGFPKCHSRGFLITGRHRFLNFLYKATDAASAPTVDLGLPFSFADALFRRFNIGHFTLKLGWTPPTAYAGLGRRVISLLGTPVNQPTKTARKPQISPP